MGVCIQEWEIDVRDWQTRCSSVREEEAVEIKFLRLAPTVGCEADSVAQEQRWRHLPSATGSDGSYVADLTGVQGAPGDVEACFPLSRDTRLRVVLQLTSPPGAGLRQVELHHEHRYASGGLFQPLEADSTVSAFAKKQKLNQGWLHGWMHGQEYWREQPGNGAGGRYCHPSHFCCLQAGVTCLRC